MQPHHFSNVQLGLAEFVSGGVVAAFLHIFAHLPPIVGAAIGSSIAGAFLRLADATLRAWGERIKRKMPYTHTIPAPPLHPSHHEESHAESVESVEDEAVETHSQE